MVNGEDFFLEPAAIKLSKASIYDLCDALMSRTREHMHEDDTHSQGSSYISNLIHLLACQILSLCQDTYQSSVLWHVAIVEKDAEIAGLRAKV